MEFIDAVKQGSLTDIRKCKKADLHNHFVLGGRRSYLKRACRKGYSAGQDAASFDG